MTFGIFGAQSASAAIPKVINYQSRLRNSGLSAITASTTIQFTIYNDLSAGSYTDPATAGGPLLWKEIHDGGACAKAQPDADGYFSVQLGACTAFPSYIDWNQPLYLGVQIESDPEASPRVLLAAFQYALNSDAVDTFSASSTAAADTLLALDSNLNFNILTGGFLGGYFTMSSTTANNGIAGNLSIAGNSIIGDSSADLVTVNGRFNSDLIPSLDLTYSLGSASNRWNAFLGNVTSVNVTSSNFFTDTFVATNGTVTNNFGVTNIVWTNATGTNTTSTNLFSTNFGATTATIQNLVLGSPLNLTNLTWVNGTGTNTTSTYFFANTSTIVSLNSTYGSFTELTIVNATAGTLNATTVTTTNLFVGGRAVCLEDGTNCLTSPETDSLLTVTNRGSVATATVTLFGGLVSANLTVTGTSNLQGTTFTNATGTNLVVTNVTSTNASSSNLQANIATFATATVSGQAICLSNGVGCPSAGAEADTLASVTNRGAFATSSVTLFGGLTVSDLTATGTTSLQNTTITNGTTTNFAVTGLVNSNLIPAADLAFSLGNATNRWNANLGNVTSTSVTTTNLFGDQCLRRYPRRHHLQRLFGHDHELPVCQCHRYQSLCYELQCRYWVDQQFHQQLLDDHEPLLARGHVHVFFDREPHRHDRDHHELGPWFTSQSHQYHLGECDGYQYDFNESLCHHLRLHECDRKLAHLEHRHHQHPHLGERFDHDAHFHFRHDHHLQL
jgi:hypothetical protein